MKQLKTAIVAVLISFLFACSHPIEIVGEGDVTSASGTRNCYLEYFQQGAEDCTKNLVIGEYIETYYAVPRSGWTFSKWLNCADSSNDQCSFNIPADLVEKNWGVTVEPLIAVFTRNAAPPANPKPKPKPVAVYSYTLDSRGQLLNPRPLEGAKLQRKRVYISFTGEFSKINFWCCKVPQGNEIHMPRISDNAAPFVLQVDMGALADDGGLQRELYADLFTSKTEYTGHFASWTLDPAPNSQLIFEDGKVHNIDYTIDAEVFLQSQYNEGTGSYGGTLNILPGGNVRSIVASPLASVNVIGGTVNSLSSENSTIDISGGAVKDVSITGFLGQGSISGGKIGSIYSEAEKLLISGGTIERLGPGTGVIEITGGLFLNTIDIRNNGAGKVEIKGGEFRGNFTYLFTGLSRPNFKFFGRGLAVTGPQPLPDQTNESSISGTLLDGSSISNRIVCYDSAGSHGDSIAPCSGVELVNQ